MNTLVLSESARKAAIEDRFSAWSMYWERVYDDQRSEDAPFHTQEMQKRRETILALIESQGSSGLTLLDVGCGAGGILTELQLHGHKCFGMDLCLDMLKRASAHSKRLGQNPKVYCQSEAEMLPFRDNQFEGVVCCGVLQYLENEQGALRQMSETVKDGGFVIATFPNMLKLSCLLDPAYYFAKLCRVALARRRIRTAKSEEAGLDDLVDIHKNTDFSNKRYFYWSMDKHFVKCSLRRETTVAIGFGPLTFGGHKLLPQSWSVRMSRIFTSLANKKGFGSMRVLANRWVVLLRKESR